MQTAQLSKSDSVSWNTNHTSKNAAGEKRCGDLHLPCPLSWWSAPAAYWWPFWPHHLNASNKTTKGKQRNCFWSLGGNESSTVIKSVATAVNEGTLKGAEFKKETADVDRSPQSVPEDWKQVHHQRCWSSQHSFLEIIYTNSNKLHSFIYFYNNLQRGKNLSAQTDA